MEKSKVKFIEIALTLFLIILFMVPGLTFATNYFVSSSKGNDNNDGLTVVTPWKTMAKVAIKTSNFLPGDVISFKCGEVFNDTTLSIQSSGTPANPIIFTNYGTGAKPVIWGPQELPEMKIASKWTQHSGDIWKMTYTATSRLWLNGEEVLRIDPRSATAIISNVGTINSQGVREYWLQSGTTLYLYSTSNPALSYSSIKGNTGGSIIYISEKSNIVIDGLDIQGGTLNVVLITCTNVVVKNCSVPYGNTGIQIMLGSSDITIENNEIDSRFRFKYGLGSDRGNMDGVHIRGGSNCIIRNNIFNDWNHLAFTAVSYNTGTPAISNNNKFYNNTVSAPNISYGRGFETAGTEGNCSGNEIYNNSFKDLTVRSQIGGNNNWIHHNIIDGVTRSDVKMAAISQALALTVFGTNYVCHDNKIDNNLIMNISEEAIRLDTYGYPNLLQNNFIRNNILYNTGLTPKVLNPGVAISLGDDRFGENNTFQNNDVYNPSALEANAIMNISSWITIYKSVAEFNIMNGNNGNTISNNLQLNPLFKAGSDNHLQITSPCIDAGIIILGLTFDFAGNPIYTGSISDIGLYETIDSTGTNLLYNPGFENGTTSWTGNACTISSSSTDF